MSVLSGKYGGGPHGLGDPNDKSLRKVELDVLIPQKMRDITRDEKCTEVVKQFTQCCKDSSVFMVFTCRKENKALKECLTKWYADEEFRSRCRNEYLEERSEYRRTGISQSQRRRVANNM